MSTVIPIEYEPQIPPVVPAPVVTPTVVGNLLTLSWPALSSMEQILGFNIYQGTPWLKEPVQIGGLEQDARSFTCEIPVDRGDWFYFVRSFGRTESENSNAVTIRQFSDEKDGTNWVTYIADGILKLRSLTDPNKVGVVGAGGNFKLISQDYRAVRGEKLATDTSLGSIDIYLPLNPAVNDQIQIVDAAGSWHAHNLIIKYEGVNIDENDGDLICDVPGASLIFTFNSRGVWGLYRK